MQTAHPGPSDIYSRGIGNTSARVSSPGLLEERPTVWHDVLGSNLKAPVMSGTAAAFECIEFDQAKLGFRLQEYFELGLVKVDAFRILLQICVQPMRRVQAEAYRHPAGRSFIQHGNSIAIVLW
jgi:hypothetical protein